LNEQDIAKKAYDYNGVANPASPNFASLVQNNRLSVPACDSTGCKTSSAADGWNVPSIAPEILGPNATYKKKGSIPACDSTGCKTATATSGWNVPGDAPYVYGPDLIYSLNERTSIPACNSTGCKTASSSSGWNVPTMSPEVYGNNGEYTYATNDHIH
jgi:hypothetical protein